MPLMNLSTLLYCLEMFWSVNSSHNLWIVNGILESLDKDETISDAMMTTDDVTRNVNKLIS